MPISGRGWELFIQRKSEQVRNGRTRTIGTYQVFHDGEGQDDLTGIAVESKGPGDNAVRGNGRRIEAGHYPIGTQAGAHYVSIGYLVSTDCDQTPKPGIELLSSGTGNRTEILVHPGHGFLASIGCINLSDPLHDGTIDIPFVNSRDRVIAAIKDLRAFSGNLFPHYNGQPIANAFVVIDGEP